MREVEGFKEFQRAVQLLTLWIRLTIAIMATSHAASQMGLIAALSAILRFRAQVVGIPLILPVSVRLDKALGVK